MRRGVRRPQIDFIGAALLSTASVLLLFALVWAGDKYPWASPQIIGLLVATAIFVLAFIFQERRHPEPMMPLHLFKNRVFVLSNLIVFTLGVGMLVCSSTCRCLCRRRSVHLRQHPASSPPAVARRALRHFFGGQLIARTGRYKYISLVGAFVIVGAMLFLTRLDIDTPEPRISAAMVVLGLGFGMLLPTMSLVVQNAVPYQYLEWPPVPASSSARLVPCWGSPSLDRCSPRATTPRCRTNSLPPTSNRSRR